MNVPDVFLSLQCLSWPWPQGSALAATAVRALQAARRRLPARPPLWVRPAISAGL
jgi:hypothetical protein